MSLKELTYEKHKEAETQPFIKVLFSGRIDPQFYATFLHNQHPVYEFLEVCAMRHGLLDGLPDVRRAPKINEDYLELWPDENHAPALQVVQEYLDYIKHLSDTNPQALFAHVYVRHMGDLAGGQMIAKKVPGEGRMYKFEDADALKSAIRERLSDDMADEANRCFDFAIKMFQQMMELDMNKQMAAANE